MGKTNKYYTIFLGLFLLLNISGYSQQAQKPSLVEVLKQVETRYNIQFNYAQDVVENIFLDFPDETLGLADALNYLRQQTRLNFNVLDNAFVIISRPDDLMLCGFLKDESTQAPVAYATIQSGNDSEVSDESGFFNIKIERPTDSIEIRHIGYKPVKVQVSQFQNSTCEDIVLSQNIEALSEVLLSSYIVPGISKLNNGTFQIDVSKFDILPGLIDTDILQAVQAFPGIQSVNETVSNINIRGGTHDQNLILWDGIKMYQSGHFFGLISMYNPQITQKVSLQKSGSDVSLTDGVSGTIAMNTGSELNQDFTASVGVNFTDVNAFADIPIGKKSSIQVAARKSLSDWVKTPTYNTFFDRIVQDTEVTNNVDEVINSNQDFDFYDTSFRWLYHISEKDQLRLNFINTNNELMFDEVAVDNSEEISRRSSLKQNSIAGGLSYERTWSSKLSTSFEVYETDYKLEAINANVLDSQRFLQENKVSETSVRLKADHKISPQISLTNGYHFVETKVTNLDDVDVPIFRALISEVVRTHGVFSQINWSSKDKNTFAKGGLRFNYIDKFEKIIVEPRISFNHRLGKYFTLEVLGEFKHQYTSQIINFQNDFLGIEKRRWQLSNDNTIPILRSKQASVGIHYNKKGWLASLESFYKNVDGITTQSQGFQNQYEFVRTSGSYDAFGFDVLLRKRFKKTNIWMSYTFLNNDYEFDALPEQNFPSNFDITHAITLGSTYTTKSLKLSAGLNWHSGTPATPINTGQPIIDEQVNFGAANSTELNDYFRVDLSAIYKFNLGPKTKAQFGLSIWNVLDRNNKINRFFRIDENNVDRIIQNSLGFTPNATFRAYF
ncbi:TonB-dependent receptor plug domain-containing protein [Winogradskyella sp. 3972H.M.0a.05]|uniref:TonB-dependent receptor n=1 Tax=Winogradskyella sp. 3972H.M.0a.05 TaxID=2950277 RepID=UPI0033997125